MNEWAEVAKMTIAILGIPFGFYIVLSGIAKVRK